MKKGILEVGVFTLILTLLLSTTAFASGARIWMEAQDAALQAGESTTVIVHVDTDQPVNAYRFDLSFNPGLINIQGVEAGPDGFMAASAVKAGLLKVNGFEAEGKGPGADMQFLVLKVNAISPGKASITLVPRIFVDKDGKAIEVSEVKGISLLIQ